jgi:teichuronic acid exporter
LRTSYWRDVLWQASGNTLAQVVGVLGIPLLARLYTPEDFALQSLFIQIVTGTAILITLRFETLIQLPKSDLEAKRLHQCVIALGSSLAVLVTLLCFGFGAKVGDWLRNPLIGEWLPLAPVSALLISWSLSSQNILQRQRDFKNSGISELASKIFNIGFGTLSSFLGAGPVGLLLTTAGGALGKIVFLRRVALPSIQAPEAEKYDQRFQDIFRKTFRQYGKLSASLVVSGILTTYSTAAPTFAVSQLFGQDALGHLSLVTLTLYLPAGLVGSAIGQVFYQRAAATWSNNEDIHALWKVTFRKVTLLGIPLYMAVAVLAPFAYPLIFGSVWEKAGEIAIWMCLPACISLISSPTDRTCLIVGAWWYPITWHAFRATTASLLIYAAKVHDWHFDAFVIGLAMQLTSSYMVDLLAEYHFSKRRKNEPKPL